MAVDLEALQNEVRLMVQDQGTGIAPQDLPHIFKRFFRADSARYRQAGGSGLGLAIARKLTEAHGGTISVSNLQGGGAKFEVIMPRS